MSRHPELDELLRHEYRERCPDHPAHEADLAPAQHEDVELGVVAGPILKRFGRARPPEPSHEIAVRVEDADRGSRGRREPFLPTGFAQQGGRREDRRGIPVLVVEERRQVHDPCLREKMFTGKVDNSGRHGAAA